jgi:HSP20 family molecular chaperone IbpA
MMNALIPFNHLDEMLDGFLAPRACAPRDGAAHRMPAADILEGEKDYLIRLDMPGVARESLSIELEDQTLKVSAERELPAPEGYTSRRKELAGKVAYRRAFSLGQEIDVEKIGAKLEDGVLTITLPKAEQVLPRRIQVQ